MGIKYLNQYLMKNCSSNAIKKTGLQEFQGKTIVVDISIYIYKFLVDGQYMEHLYLFLGLFHYYQITPIFIFDGKPPPEKWDLIKKRRSEKKAAQLEYNELIVRQVDGTINMDVQEKLDLLKKKMVTLKDADLVKTKELIAAFGYTYFEAVGEADELCAYFVLTGIAWACLTDDMDMFLYGCPRVIRNLSMMKKEAVLYNTQMIIADLQIHSLYDFIQILILLGTDYSTIYTIGIKQAIDYYREYKGESEQQIDWYNWLQLKCELPEENPFTVLYQQFISVYSKSELHIYKELYMKQFAGQFQIEKIRELLESYGFIFI